jgi:hypothetical protein
LPPGFLVQLDFGREMEALAGLWRHPLIIRFSPVARVNIPLARENLHLVIPLFRDAAAVSLVIQLLMSR